MIWKNPFQIKRLEHTDSPSVFLQLFNCSALKILETDAFRNVTFFTSSPGAGKTTFDCTGTSFCTCIIEE